jgi:hypothetical protein
MPQIGTGLFTVGVFQDTRWADRALDALKRHGFALESLTVLGADAPDVHDLLRRTFGGEPARSASKGLGVVLATGPLVDAIQGDGGALAQVGLAAAIKGVGFQSHDGFIFETLVRRGGVMVAVLSEPRAADALAVLHAYGGGNAAIGAWRGRV